MATQPTGTQPVLWHQTLNTDNTSGVFNGPIGPKATSRALRIDSSISEGVHLAQHKKQY